MQVSMSTGCVHHLPAEGIADIAAEAGFKHVEVLLNPEMLDGIGEMAEALASRSLKATVVHAPFSLDGLLSAPARREEALALARQALEATVAVGAPMMTIHPGTSGPRGTPPAEYIATAQANIAELQGEAADRGVELLVENTSAHYILGIKVSGLLGNTPEEMESFVGPLDAPQRRMTFDTSHASTLKKVSIPTFIREMGRRIGNLHLSDSNAFIDHLPIGFGRIDFVKVFQALRAIEYDGNATLELRPRHSTAEELRRNRVLVETELSWRSDRQPAGG